MSPAGVGVGRGRVYVDTPALAAGWLYVAAKTISESHRRNESLSLNCLNSSVWSARSAVIASSNPFSLVSVVTALPTLPETD